MAAKTKAAKSAQPAKKGGTAKGTKAKVGARAKNKAGAKSRNDEKPVRTAGKDLVIVESPAKARTVGQILGNKYVVAASQGHLRDLPKSVIGVDVQQEFQPSYVVMQDKRKLLNTLKKAGDEANQIYLATDPDREGEAISWHLQTAAKWDNRSQLPKRVVFHEITKDAVEEAFRHPRDIDMQLVNAQQARRILDRLVGYQVSPLLWRRVQRGLSAGRVQSAALRMVVDRENEIQAFVPVESWTIEAELNKDTDAPAERRTFNGVLHSVKGSRRRLNIAKEDEAQAFKKELEGAAFAVDSVTKRDVRQRPAAPFTTSTLQQEAGRKLRFTAQRTMAVAQQLYEGLTVGPGGPVGLITYMRTDSPRVSDSAIQEARKYIRERYGKDYAPDKPRVYSSRAKTAQEAHEAIRPTSIARTPDALRPHLSKEQLDLYSLVWARMLASQMADAISEATSVDIDAVCKPSSGAHGSSSANANAANTYLFRATGSVLKFPGFRTLYLESRDDEQESEGRQPLPPLEKGNGLDCQKLEALQHFTQPPPRYTEATLIKSMEEKGIGRPSTYAPTIGTLLDRNYVDKERNRLTPTPLGKTVSDLLSEHFTQVMDLDFTAKMEEELDSVSQGDREWVPMLQDFYDPFNEAVNKANESFSRAEETDEVCEKCGQPMAIKTGRFGRFMACTGYPKCRNTKDMGDNPGTPFEEATDEICEKCDRPMVIRVGRYGRFLACTGYNADENPCENRRNLLKKTGLPCPKCGGDIVERRARGKGRARPFWGCSNYPNCDLLLNQRPVKEPCPECDGMMVESGRNRLSCTVCSWTQSATAYSGDPADELAAAGV